MKPKMIVQIAVDFGMTVLLLLLMAKQLTGNTAHEWLGLGMFLLWIAHHLLNIRWHTRLFQGGYTPLRAVQTAVNLLLFLSAAVPTPITVPQPSGSSKASHLAEFARSRYSWYSSFVIVCPDSFSLVSGKSSSADSSAASAPCDADASSYTSSSVTVGSSFFSPHAESIMTADRTAHSLKYLLILHPPCIFV